MRLLNSILWDANAVLVDIPVIDRPLLWYGLLCIISFLAGRKILISVFRHEHQPAHGAEKLATPVLVSALVGARLGHCFFFEPLYYLQHPVELLAFWQGGLSGHGAVAGVCAGVYLYALKFKLNYLWLLDRLAIVAALATCLLRIGNFINADLIGVPTHSRYGVVFGHDVESVLQTHDKVVKEADITYSQVQVDTMQELAPLTIQITFQPGITEWTARSYLQHQVKAALAGHRAITAQVAEPPGRPIQYYMWKEGESYMAAVETLGIPRHPVPLYEAVYGLLLFVLLYYGWKTRQSTVPAGLLLGTFLVMLFGFKLLNDFFRISLTGFDAKSYLNTSQLLSIPFVMVGLVVLLGMHRRRHSRQQKNVKKAVAGNDLKKTG